MVSTQHLMIRIGDTFVRISGEGSPLAFVHGITTRSLRVDAETSLSILDLTRSSGGTRSRSHRRAVTSESTAEDPQAAVDALGK